MALEAADEEDVAEGACEAGDQGNVQRLYPVDAKGVDRLGIGGPGHAAAVRGPQPVFGAAESHLVPGKMDGCLGIDHAKAIGLRNRALRNDLVITGGEEIVCGKELNEGSVVALA